MIKEKKIKITFGKGVEAVIVPFLAELGSYDQLYKQMARIEPPRNARGIKCTLECFIDLKPKKHLNLSNRSAQVTVLK